MIVKYFGNLDYKMPAKYWDGCNYKDIQHSGWVRKYWTPLEVGTYTW